ncbi:hypothetical protein EK21DRAFT_84780 [Setomelanomma holmii]|uniref:Uncharacterized protein n=1 Tax=Setomelanomma holmii TaxID=210430 RepID=A0A9P4HL31_9PLEO|nr:hypothetical protein EK21DRAFT_84780 [Setomelanomma holmii]
MATTSGSPVFPIELTPINVASHATPSSHIGADDGSSAILFGWRFTPTLIAVLYAQMTVILFEDVKRTEPFARLANAPAGGANAYGTLLQTPRAWWSIFIDVADTSVTFPFWPTTEAAQFGPKLVSSLGSWKSETTTLASDYTCQNMTLESANLTAKRYSDVYTVQGYGPLNGTQPMITFVLTSGDGCRYELSMHPAVDMAYSGSVTWSNTSIFYPTLPSNIAVGRGAYPANVTSTHIYARFNASEQCKGRDIILISTPWTVPIDISASRTPGLIPQNQTYERASDFRMRGLLCQSEYLMSNHSMTMRVSGSSQLNLNASAQDRGTLQKIPDALIDQAKFQFQSIQNDWKTFFDEHSTLAVTAPGSQSSTDANGKTVAPVLPGFSGMAPLLSALSNYSVGFMMDDQDLVRKAAMIKGRFLTETVREAFSNPELLDTDVAQGEGVIVESRVIVLTEIGFSLAALFFAISALLGLIFCTSRLSIRPLNLRSDPASAVGLSLLLIQHRNELSTVRSLHQSSRVDLYTTLQGEKFLTANGDLLTGNDNTDPPIKVKARRTWKPSVIRVRMLLALGFFLTLVLVAVLVLNAFSARSQLSQIAFVYGADISKLGLSFTNFAPISIAPTVVSIVVRLWWDQLDMTWRILQPFIAMSRGPTSMNSGAGLTYRSKSWVGAAFKAGRNRHWVLLMIAIGIILAQVLTVSMSALFERELRTVTQERSLPRSLEMRQVPNITEVDVSGMQQSFNGSQLPWTSDGWSFLPIDLSNVLNDTNTSASTRLSDATSGGTTFSTNVTLRVPALRARLDCSTVEEISNTSAWIEFDDLTDKAENFMPNVLDKFNKSGKIELYSLPTDNLIGSDAHTTVLSTDVAVRCCQNGSATDPQRSLLGYWSPVIPSDKTPNFYDYPYENLPWLLTLTTKWIVGRPVVVKDYNDQNVVLFEQQPKIQMARCVPIIETAEAKVSVDANTSYVHYYEIEGNAAKADVAWADVFTRHEISKARINSTTSSAKQNLTASFGVLFLDSLLGSADRQTGSVGRASYEAVTQNAFVFRDERNGINMDLMTYSMYTLAKQDSDALLNYTTMARLADQTFQTFFQQFVNSGLSLSKGGYAYQTIQDNSMEALGKPVDINGSSIAAAKSFPVLNTARTITASVSHRVRVLHMNTTATYLSTAILVWLIFTAVTVLSLQRRYTSFMNRDVQLIADMLVLIAGSDNFLELVAEKGVDLKKNKDIKTMLGWFRDRDGQIRWGVELVGGQNAVDWVDAPKTGFHIPSNSSRRWKCW